jgi:hypothetical protein
VIRSADQLRADARALLLRARDLDAENRGGRLSAPGARGGRRGLHGGDSAAVANATSVVARADQMLAELKSRGYRQLPNGRWVNPRGKIVKGT